MHHTELLLTSPLLPYISPPELRYVPYLSGQSFWPALICYAAPSITCLQTQGVVWEYGSKASVNVILFFRFVESIFTELKARAPRRH